MEKNAAFWIKIFRTEPIGIFCLIFKTPPQMAFSVSMETFCDVCLCVKWMKRQLCEDFDLKSRFECVNDTLGLCIICAAIKLQFYDALTRHTVKYIFYFAAAPYIPLLRVNRKNKHKYWFVLVEPTVCWVAVSKQSIKSKSIPMLHAKMCIGSTRLNCHIGRSESHLPYSSSFNDLFLCLSVYNSSSRHRLTSNWPDFMHCSIVSVLVDSMKWKHIKQCL